jgi:hypothetical protein
MELMPNEKVPYDLFVPGIAEAYYNCSDTLKGDAIVNTHLDLATEDLSYFMTLESDMRQSVDYELRLALQVTQDYRRIAATAGRQELAARAEELFTINYQRYIQQPGMPSPQPQPR